MSRIAITFAAFASNRYDLSTGPGSRDNRRSLTSTLTDDGNMLRRPVLLCLLPECPAKP